MNSTRQSNKVFSIVSVVLLLSLGQFAFGMHDMESAHDTGPIPITTEDDFRETDTLEEGNGSQEEAPEYTENSTLEELLQGAAQRISRNPGDLGDLLNDVLDKSRKERLLGECACCCIGNCIGLVTGAISIGGLWMLINIYFN